MFHAELESIDAVECSLATVGPSRPKIVWLNVIGIGGVHLLSLLVLVPELFSWTGVAVTFVGLFFFGLLGTNLCFHRLLTHRSFECPRPLEHFLAVLGTCCLQDTPAWWV